MHLRPKAIASALIVLAACASEPHLGGAWDTEAGDAVKDSRLTRAGAVSLQRVLGESRGHTAAEVARVRIPDRARSVYLTTDTAMADALAGGPMATDGPMLYVTVDDIPAVTAAEITRLSPSRIVAFGGPSVLGSDVLRQAQALAPGADIERIHGATRFDTAAAIAERRFPGRAAAVYLARADTFADAIAAVAMATDGPLLFTAGDELPEATRSSIERLAPRTIVVLGGPDVVSSAAVASAREAAGSSRAVTRRLHGATRFHTAAAISRARFPAGAPVAYIVSGHAAADGLTGAPMAQDGPLLFATGYDLPRATIEEITRLGPSRILVIGGPTAVGELAASQAREASFGDMGAAKTIFVVPHPDDEVSNGSYWLRLRDRGGFPVFALMTQGSQSGHCVANGGKGSAECKARRLSSWHGFLDEFFEPVAHHHSTADYDLFVGSDSARVVFDFGDQDVTAAEVRFAIEQVRDLPLVAGEINRVVAAGYLGMHEGSSIYEHPDHVAVHEAVRDWEDNARVTRIGSAHPEAVPVLRVDDYDHYMDLVDRHYSWLSPPAWPRGRDDTTVGSFKEYQSFGQLFPE